jgi:hypothetical protein
LRRLVSSALAALLSVAVFAGCASLDAHQRRWIFQPAVETPWADAREADGMQDVWIAFDSATTGRPARLHGLWLPQPDGASGAPAPLLLYLHGARWDVMGSAERIRRMHALGFGVLAIDYRGFGKSGSELPSERSAYEDARAAWRWLAAQRPEAPRYVFGHSLGSAIAVDLAAAVHDEAGLVVEGAFPSIPAVVASMPWGWLPLGPLIWQRFDALSKIGRVGSPTLVVHGSDDALIPPALGHTLYEGARAPKRWLLVEGGTHHSTNRLGEAAYRDALRALFGIAAPASGPAAHVAGSGPGHHATVHGG